MRSLILRLMLLLAFANLVLTHARAADGYLVRQGDALSVSIFGQPDLSGPVTVRSNGTIPLHLFGPVQVEGKTVDEIEKDIISRANSLFTGEISVIVKVDEYQRVFVLGGVQQPGAYPYRPGLDVIRAIASAGGYERTDPGTDRSFRESEAVARAQQMRARIVFAEARLDALNAELERIAQGESPDMKLEEGSNIDALLRNSIRLRRSRLEEEVGNAERQSELATKEAESFAERKILIQRQLAATSKQLEDIQKLVSQGLARADRALSLQLSVDDYRADELEAGAYEARARQTAARSESSRLTEVARYHEDILREKIDVEQQIEIARSELAGTLEFLRANQAYNDASTPILEPVFEIYRSGSDAEMPEIGALTTPLGPDDVLKIRFQPVFGQ